MQYAICSSSLGLVLVAESAAGISAVLLGDDAESLRADLERRWPDTELVPGDPDMLTRAEAVARAVDSPAELETEVFTLAPIGTAFQRSVWDELRQIPAGATVSYRDIAERIGRPEATRAVAQACAANPIAVLVPCHRVVRADGQLGGYRWGPGRKTVLLQRESQVAALS
jgi:AraC family transcriptional regulator, regulatory protein of adaptative response / methylated-DNA-[protein]-cysteine methyltransferase